MTARILFVIVMLFGLTACPKGGNPVCDAIKIGLDPIAQLLSGPEIAKCADPVALAACFQADLDKTPICKPAGVSEKGLIGNLVCPRIADYLKNYALKGYCPLAKCTGGDLVGVGYDKAIAICKSQVPF